MNLRNALDPASPCCEFTQQPVNRTCWGDGHYLCRCCRRLDPLGTRLFQDLPVPDVVVLDAAVAPRRGE